VVMHYSETTHYQLDHMDSNHEYAKLLPSGQHLVTVDDDSGVTKNYTVTLFHQMKCLDIIRRTYVKHWRSGRSRTIWSNPDEIFTQHCLNYLHQTILCRPHLGLESTHNSKASASRDFEMVCRDWTEVYKEAECNHAMYTQSR
ncbi:hypothetical protein K435DRAFT_679731, partial [Dendrothele bispora CBS 962.96]